MVTYVYLICLFFFLLIYCLIMSHSGALPVVKFDNFVTHGPGSPQCVDRRVSLSGKATQSRASRICTVAIGLC